MTISPEGAGRVSSPTWRLVFGYRAVEGVPVCPCRDGNSVSMEQDTSDPLHLRFRCWCGRTIEAHMDDQRELDDLLAQNGLTLSANRSLRTEERRTKCPECEDTGWANETTPCRLWCGA